MSQKVYRTTGPVPLPEKSDRSRPFQFVPQSSASLIEKAYKKKQSIHGNKRHHEIINDGLRAQLEEQVPVMKHHVDEENVYASPHYIFGDDHLYQNVPMILDSEKSSMITPPPVAFQTNPVYDDYGASADDELQNLKDLLLAKKRKLQDAQALLGEAEELIIQRYSRWFAVMLEPGGEAKSTKRIFVPCNQK